jgi:Domain of unknown function (DUF4167)
MKRQRGRGRKPGGGGHHNYQNHNQPNRTMESNGPEVKVRGPAAVIYERYLQLARDASSSGDRVLGENYLQHADHYFRLLRAIQPAAPAQPTGERYGEEGDREGDAGRDRDNGDAEAQADGAGQPNVEFPQGQQPQPQDRDGEFRRRRGRRSRFQPGGEGESTTASEESEAGPERSDERERPQREGDAPAEGFSTGPKPAFLGSD